MLDLILVLRLPVNKLKLYILWIDLEAGTDCASLRVGNQIPFGAENAQFVFRLMRSLHSILAC